LTQFPDVKIVVIDTLQFIKYRQGKSESAYETDYRTGRDLKEFAEKKDIAIVVVTHTTKMRYIDDDMANVSGTNGVTGAADSVIVLGKEKRTDSEAKMFITGRKVRQTMHNIKFDDAKCRWEYIGVAEVSNKDQREKEER
jgi:RecA-family ATPase